MGMSAFVAVQCRILQQRRAVEEVEIGTSRTVFPQDEATPFVLVNAEYIDPNPSADRLEMGPNGQPPASQERLLQVSCSQSKDGRERQGTVPQSETCSQGYDSHNPKPCAGCMAMDMGTSRLNRHKFVFALVHLVPYHRHPQIDYQTGKYKTDKEGKPYFTFSECEGRTCNLPYPLRPAPGEEEGRQVRFPFVQPCRRLNGVRPPEVHRDRKVAPLQSRSMGRRNHQPVQRSHHRPGGERSGSLRKPAHERIVELPNLQQRRHQHGE